jgi:hypothetical protein
MLISTLAVLLSNILIILTNFSSQRDGILRKEEIEKGLRLAKDFKKSNSDDVEHSVVGERDFMMDLQAMFDTMDKDRSGGISIDEFLNAFMD